MESLFRAVPSCGSQPAKMTLADLLRPQPWQLWPSKILKAASFLLRRTLQTRRPRGQESRPLSAALTLKVEGPNKPQEWEEGLRVQAGVIGPQAVASAKEENRRQD